MIKMLSCFSGIGAFEKALTNLGIKYDLVGFSEIDEYAVKSYCAIHGVSESINLGDITKINAKALPKDIDLFTYGFPCQDISLAGKQKGLFNKDGTQTRSGLFFEALRIIEETQPKVAIAENVKNLVGKKFKEQFQVVLASLESAGYNNYWAVLNLKNFGIPQNRERVFIVSIRKDIDNGEFKFPKGFPLEIRLKDILESEVDEKYYLSEKMFNYVFNVNKEAKGIGFYDGVDRSYINPEIAQTIGCRSAAFQRSGVSNYVSENASESISVADMKKAINPQIRQIGQMYPNSGNPQAGRIYDADGISPTMDTCSGGNRMPKVLVDEPLAYDEQNRYIRKDGIVGTIMTDGSSPKKNNRIIEPQLRIRKLTPKECFRLMGFDDADFEKAEVVNSNTQLYKQAGNSIGVPVLEHIYKALLKCGAIGDT